MSCSCKYLNVFLLNDPKDRPSARNSLHNLFQSFAKETRFSLSRAHNMFISHHFSFLHLTLLILAVSRTHAIHEPCIWCSSPRVLYSSIVRVSDQCRGHRFSFCRGLRLFLCPVLVTCWSHHFSLFFTELKIHHLSFVKIN